MSGQPVSIPAIDGARAGLQDREGALAKLMIAPAILYIVAMIGVPFVLAILYSLSDATTGDPALTSRRPAELRRGAGGSRLPALPAEHRRLHPGLPVHRRRPVPAARHRPPQEVPGKVARPVPHHAPVDGADLARDDRLALDARLDLQPHRLGPALRRAARRPGRPPRSGDEPLLPGRSRAGHVLDHPRGRVADPPPGDGHPAGGDELHPQGAPGGRRGGRGDPVAPDL